jgi:hypothetical protein
VQRAWPVALEVETDKGLAGMVEEMFAGLDYV